MRNYNFEKDIMSSDIFVKEEPEIDQPKIRRKLLSFKEFVKNKHHYISYSNRTKYNQLIIV
jgi:hypothetical protein